MRCQQKTACITLVFFIFHPALAKAQSQKSQFWRIPVLPSDAGVSPGGVDSTTIAPAPERAESFGSLLQVDSDKQPTAHGATVPNRNLQQDQGVLRSLGQAGFSVLGAETVAGDLGRLSLRASSGQAPVVYLEGVPMSSGFSSFGAENFIPPQAIDGIDVYPLISPSGLPRRGNSGSFNVRLLTGREKRLNAFGVSFAEPRAIHLSQVTAPSCVNELWYGCVSASWQVNARSGIVTVRDDNNTPDVLSDDSEQKLLHNEATRLGAHVKTRKVGASGIVFEFSSVLGAQKRGLNGNPVRMASPSNRAESEFYMLTHSASSFSPVTGTVWNYSLSGRFDEALFNTSMNNQSQVIRQDKRTERVVMGNVGVIKPLSGQMRPRIFLSGSYERNAFDSRIQFPLKQQESSNSLVPSLSRGTLESLDAGGGAEFLAGRTALIRGEAFVQWLRTAQNSSCGSYAVRVICESSLGSLTRVSPGVSVEIQKKIMPSIVSYGLFGKTVRLPHPIELLGRPDGVVANRNLLPETSTIVEIGLQNSFFHTGVYGAQDLDLIALEQVGPYLVQFQNRSRARRYGFFGSAEAHYGQFQLSLSYERAWAWVNRTQSERVPVPFVPASQTVTKLNYQWPFQLFEMVEPATSLSYRQSGAYYLDADATYRLTPPSQIDIAFHSDLPLAEQQVAFEVAIRNALNQRVSRLKSASEEVRDVGWSYRPALPIAGRSVVVSFNFKTS